MVVRSLLCILIAALSASSALAEMRPWKSADGTRSLQGDFVKRTTTTVTIKTDAGKELVIQLSKLHPDESQWLDARHSLKSGPPAPDPTAFFDNLTFRDTRTTTEAKLKVSKLVEMTTDEAFIGRSGLNGIFRTRQKIGTLDGFLYFDWTSTGRLKELNLQTEPRPNTAYNTELEPSWKKFVELLTTLYGKPVQNGPLPPIASLTDGAFSPSHLWNIKTGGCALLGTARTGTVFQVVVRFSERNPQLMELP